MIDFVTEVDIELDIDCDIIIDNFEFNEKPIDSIYLQNRESEEVNRLRETESQFNVHYDEIISKYHSGDLTLDDFNFFDSDYVFWNKLVPMDLRDEIKRLCEYRNVKIYRTMITRLSSANGLTIHSDAVKKFHYPLKTNPHCFFYDAHDPENQVVYNLKQNKLYDVDTTRHHYFYNASDEDRLHLIMYYEEL